VASRVALSPSTHLDESEQMVLTQSLQWGYGSQPPLYTWLQSFVFAATGPSVLGLSLLKNALLLTTCLFAFGIGRRATGSLQGGVLSALALAFLPDLVWEAQRDLTHSILAATLALAAIWTFLRLCDSGRWPRYLAFGTVLGLGCLSKYNFAIASAGLICAALTFAEGRRAVVHWRFAAALALTGLILAPHGWWFFSHQGLALASTGKFKVAAEASWPQAPLRGMAQVLKLALGATAPALLIFGATWMGVRRHGKSTSAQPFAVRLMCRQLVFAATLVLLGVVVSRVTGFRGRWFLPMLVPLPVLGTALVWPQLDAVRARGLGALAIVAALVVTVLLPCRIVFAERMQRFEPLHVPYARLAPQIAPLADSNTVVLAENNVIAGNLRLAGLDATVVSPETWAVIPHPGARRILVVWDATRQSAPTEGFADALKRLALETEPEPRFFTARCFYHRSRITRLAAAPARPVLQR
jgi:4-amino-4-deoxy-L-arabinose transferase-like glycosyltransferase